MIRDFPLFGLAVGFIFAAAVPAFGTASENQCSFFWGVANSSFQVEGSPADSDVYRWTHTPHAIADGSNADRATDFWNRYDEDFQLARNLGANAFRISVAWERIEPQEGRWNEDALSHYEEMIGDMRKHGLEPVITLFHSTLPIWVADQGGVTGKNFPNQFAQYMYHAVQRLGGGPAHVKYWLTFNEPTTYAEGNYIDGKNPAHHSNDISGFMHALAGQVRAHIAGTALVRALGLPVQIGVAQDWMPFVPKHEWYLQSLAAAKVEALTYDRYFLDGVLKGKSLDILGAGVSFKIPKNISMLDFVGINYYTRKIVGGNFKFVNGEGPKADDGMEIYPEGMEQTLLKVNQLYKLPILITENGIDESALDDTKRSQALVDTIAALDRARAKGVNVLGYLHWSLTDNFEWGWGYSSRYGLVHVDCLSQDLTRTPRHSYYVYQEIIRRHEAGCGNEGGVSSSYPAGPYP